MILDHETPDDISCSKCSAEQQLDKIYHSIPEWVHRMYPTHTLAERIKCGFEDQFGKWSESCRKEIERHDKTTSFLMYLMKKYGFSYVDEYWDYLNQKNKS